MRSTKKRTTIVDIEANSLNKPDKLWTVVGKDYLTGKVSIFKNIHDNPKPVTEYLNSYEQIVGHNFIDYDAQVLRDHCPDIDLPIDKIVDTLVISRLRNYHQPGGHSLAAVGKRNYYPKDTFDDFSQWSKELEDRCVTDVELTEIEYNRFKRFLDEKEWEQSVWLEHEAAEICRELNVNGFMFDVKSLGQLYGKIKKELKIRLKELRECFPPKPKVINEITPKETKFGTIHAGSFRWLNDPDCNLTLNNFTAGAPFTRFVWEEFNPASPKQCVERLNNAGWKPIDKTKTHLDALRSRIWEMNAEEKQKHEERLERFKVYGWKVNETNLATLPEDAPEGAQKLAEYILLDSRRSTLEEWAKAYSRSSQRIHGSFFSIGSWTHRMSHSAPNCANIPSIIYKATTPREKIMEWTNNPMRTMWKVPDGKILLGVDAEGIQLRMLAHYMNDLDFTKALIEGDKEAGTDAHTMNAKLLGHTITRDTAKTFIYAWILGAGIPKVADILSYNTNQAKESVKNFLDRYENLSYLKEEKIPKDALRQYFDGIDGRKVICRSEHLMLAGYLQNGEAVIMKRANVIWKKELDKLGIPYKQVNFVHDEWQTELDNNTDIIDKVIEVQTQSIKQAGEIYDLNCPMAGSYNLGFNWKETH